MATTTQTVSGIIQEIKRQDGTGPSGKPWTKWSLKIQEDSGENHYYTWFGDGAGLRTGEHAVFTYSTKENPNNAQHPYRNIQSRMPDLPPVHQPDDLSDMPPGPGIPPPAAESPVQPLIVPIVIDVPPLPPNPAAIGACANHAVDLIVAGYYPKPEGRTMDSWIWEIRDHIYWNVNQQPCMNGHFCYRHGEPFIHSTRTDSWGHVVEGEEPCME